MEENNGTNFRVCSLFLYSYDKLKITLKHFQEYETIKKYNGLYVINIIINSVTLILRKE